MNTDPSHAIQHKILRMDPSLRASFMRLRTLIYEVAHANPVIGKLEETLKWGQPSYAPQKSNIGTAIRIDAHPTQKECIVIYFHCQTSLISQFTHLFPFLDYEGNRGIILSVKEPLPTEILKEVIFLALTYKLRKKTDHQSQQGSDLTSSNA